MQRSPLVPGATTRLVAAFRVDELVAHWQAAFDIDVSGELKGIEEISLHRCEASQLEFFAPTSAAGSRELYEQLGRFDWFYMPEKWEFEQAIRDMYGCDRILEVGCGPGFFVEKAMNQLKDSTVRGTETNRAVVEKAIRRGLPVERVELEELAARGDVFDAVCSFQVLEHVTDPRHFLEIMTILLARGGKLVISVPNKDSFLRHQYNLLDMPPHHMTRWGAFTFRYLERVLSLKLLRISFEPLARYHTRGYVAAYARHWRSKLRALAPLLSQSGLRHVSEILEKSGLHGLLRGQTLYALFQRL